jgi:hypothetical protein
MQNWRFIMVDDLPCGCASFADAHLMWNMSAANIVIKQLPESLTADDSTEVTSFSPSVSLSHSKMALDVPSRDAPIEVGGTAAHIISVPINFRDVVTDSEA